MASHNVGKIKAKRNRPSKPYERGQSIIGTITNAVLPSWISRVLPWQSSSSNNDETRIISDDDQNEFKRPLPLHSSVGSADATVSLTSRTIASTSSTDSHPSPPSRVPFYSYKNSHDDNDDNVAAQDDNDDRDSVSTSGCSSMVPHVDRQSEYQQEVLPLDGSALERLRDQLSNDVRSLGETGSHGPVNSMKPLSAQATGESAFVSVGGERPFKKAKRNDNNSFLFSQDDKITEQGSAWLSTSSNTELQSSSFISKPQHHSTGRHPSFNISAFGIPLMSNNSSGSILNESANESIFYPGKTMFGGAASSQRNRSHLLNSPAPYQPNRSLRHQTKVRAKRADDIGPVSSTAKRILYTLENMSTPLSDAKRIPSKSKSQLDSFISLPSYSVRRRPNLSSRVPKVGQNGPPVRSMQMPGQTSVARHYIPSPNVISTSKSDKVLSSNVNVDVQHKSDDSSQTIVHTPTSSGGGGGGKMKTKSREAKHYSSKNVQDVETEELPELVLPEVSLNIRSLPNIDFGSSLLSDNQSTPIVSVSKPATCDLSSSNDIADSNNMLTYTFSSPVIKQTPSNVTSLFKEPDTTFTFSEPITVSSKATDANKNISANSDGFTETKRQSFPSAIFQKRTFSDTPTSEPNVTFKVPDPVQMLPKKKKADDGHASSNQGELKSGSVSDVLKSFSKDNESVSSGIKISGGFPAQFLPSADSWECEMCLVRNKAESDTCIACQSCKPSVSNQSNSEPVKSSNSSMKSSFAYDDKFKPETDVWECSACMIQNKNDIVKCIACQTAKPVTGVQEKFENLPSIYEQFKPPSSTWECSTCLVNNNNDVSKCVACQVPRCNGSSSAPSFSFSDKLSSTWECDTCYIRNKLDVNKCIACQTPRPSSVSSTNTQSNFKFGTSVQSKDDTFSSSGNADNTGKVGASSSLQPGFVFNNKNDSSTSNSVIEGFKFVESKSDNNGNNQFVNFMASPSDSKETFGDVSVEVNKPTETKTATGNFTFGTGNSSRVTESSDQFKFGVNETTDKESLMFKNSEPVAKNVGEFSFIKTAEDDSSKINVSETSSEDFTFGSKSTDGNLSGFKFNSNVDFPTVKKSVVTIVSKSVQPAEVKMPESQFSFGSRDGDHNVKSTIDSGGGFSFPSTAGVSKTASSDSASVGAASSGGFSFGSSSTAVSSGGFTFKSKVDAPKSSAEISSGLSTITSAAPSCGFVFGSSASMPKTTTPSGGFVFGASKSVSTTAPSEGFKFDSTKSSTSTASSTGFTFGTPIVGSATTKPVGEFVFGSSSTAPVDTAKRSTFSFGSSGDALKTTVASTSGGFVFESSAPITSAAPAGTFMFGSNAATPAAGTSMFGTVAATPVNTSGTTPGGFTFGPSTSSSAMPTNIGGFSFSSAPSSSVPTKQNAPTNFNFGSGSTQTNNAPAETGPTTYAPGIFAFGAVNNSKQETAGDTKPTTFGFGVTQPSSTSGFGLSNINTPSSTTFSNSSDLTFGAQPTSVVAPSNTGVSFNFGSKPPAFGTFGSGPTDAPTGINSNFTAPEPFGSQAVNTTPASGFIFGAATDNSSVFRFGATQQAASSSQASSFSGPQLPAPAPTPGGFNFTAGATPNFPVGADSNPFSVPVHQQGARRIKQAKRRINPKK